MSFIDQINQNVDIFIYNQDFLFMRGIIGSLIANNTFEIIPDFKPFFSSGNSASIPRQ